MAGSSTSLDAENGVIGSLLLDESILPKLLSSVDARDFQSEPARLAFQAARALFRGGKSVDPITVRGELGPKYSDYLAQCIERTSTTRNWEEYAALMHEQAVLGRIQAQAMQLVSAQSLRDCAGAVRAISDEFAGGRRMESWDMTELMTDFANRMSDKTPREYVSYGIPELDAGTYTELGDVVMIGGSPSDGKTALALCMAYHMAQKYNVGFFSLETGREKLEDRLVASGFQIDLAAIKHNRMDEADWQRFAEGSVEAVKRRLRIFRAGGATVERITAAARAYDLDIVFVDYVQLIEPEYVKGESRAAQVAEISRALHTFAQSSGTLVVELAQLTRQSFQERKAGVERSMFDLGETSQFEKDADLILLLYRPPKGARFVEGDKSSPELDGDKGHRLLRVAKNKEGRWGRWPLVFDGPRQSFSVMKLNGEYIMRDLSDTGKAAKAKNSARSRQQMTFEELQEKPGEDLPF